MPTLRTAARKGSVVRLNMTFYSNGSPTTPNALRQIKIYKNSASEDNLLVTVDLPLPDATDYPSPVVQLEDSSGPLDGQFYYDFTVPDDFEAPDSYIDEWHFVGDALDGIDYTDTTLWDSVCGKFFVAPSSSWYGDDSLETLRLAFEPLDKNFTKPEVRYLEVGFTLLPLYDADWNRFAPVIPLLQATISIETLNCESIVTDAPMEIAIRQGSYRTNPYVFRYLLDTSTLHIATYRYNVKVALPNGETRVSQRLHLSINS